MSPIAIALAALLVVALLALSAWIVGRLPFKRGSKDDSTGQEGHRRFDTTMGELRDLREALGAAGATARAPQTTRSKPAGSASSRAASPGRDSPPG